jgi:hypothetical protein
MKALTSRPAGVDTKSDVLLLFTASTKRTMCNASLIPLTQHNAIVISLQIRSLCTKTLSVMSAATVPDLPDKEIAEFASCEVNETDP